MANTERNNKKIHYWVFWANVSMGFLSFITSMLTFWFVDREGIFGGDTGMNWTAVIVSLLIGGCFFLLGVIIKILVNKESDRAFTENYDSILNRVNKVEKIMEKIHDTDDLKKRVDDNENSVKIIENNLLIQNSINRQTEKFIAELKNVSIKEIDLIYMKNHKEFIESRANNLKRGQEADVLQQYLSSLDQFNEPVKK